MQTNTFDTFSITITNPDSGTYSIVFQNPTTLLYTKSNPIPANADIWTVYNALYPYYSSTFGSSLGVTLQMFDVNNNLTTNAANATRYVYNVSMLKLIAGKSSSNIIVSKITSQSKIQATYIQQSSTPLSGNFVVQCIDPSGKIFKSQSINYNEHYTNIQ